MAIQGFRTRRELTQLTKTAVKLKGLCLTAHDNLKIIVKLINFAV
jgi:hypothetical protein